MKSFPMLVWTCWLYGGLNHKMFLFLFLLRRGGGGGGGEIAFILKGGVIPVVSQCGLVGTFGLFKFLLSARQVGDPSVDHFW